MKTETNVTKSKESLTINEAVQIINSATYSFFRKNRLENTGISVLSAIDFVSVEYEYMNFYKYNNCERIGIPLADIANILYISDENSPAVHFVLTDGEVWVADLCGGYNNYRQQIKSYKEIDEDEFIERLRKCQAVGVNQSIEHVFCNLFFDTIDIAYHNDDDDGESEIEVRLKDSAKQLGHYNIGIGGTKFHIEHESSNFDKVLISLCEMPLLSKLCLTLIYKV